MEENPQTFFLIMTTEPKVFSDWLSELPKLSFTSSNPAACVLETKRKQLIYLIQNANLQNRREQALRKSLTRKLSEIPDSKNCSQ